MAYSGFLFKFGEYKFPKNLMEWDKYDCYPSQRQDLDSYTDANGLTHRNAIEHTKTKVEFTTRQMTESKMDNVMSNMEQNYINSKERDAYCTYYDMESRTYKTGHMYLDPSLKFHVIGERNGNLIYGETTFKFIEY
jgi:hypothetical protein